MWGLCQQLGMVSAPRLLGSCYGCVDSGFSAGKYSNIASRRNARVVSAKKATYTVAKRRRRSARAGRLVLLSQNDHLVERKVAPQEKIAQAMTASRKLAQAARRKRTRRR